MRYLKSIVVLAVAVLALAACSATPNPGPGPGPAPANGTVTGTVSWPDGNLAAGASVYFYDYEPQLSIVTDGWSDGTYEVQPLGADGSYSLPGCPCNDLTAYIYLPGTSGGDPTNGGQDCWIIMQDDGQTYSGRKASSGDAINWQALDMPCSPTWYTSDQTTVQSEYNTVLPSLNSGSITRAPTMGSACHFPLVMSGAPVGATTRMPAPAAQRALIVLMSAA